MASNLGSLYYELRIKDLTDSDIQTINNKLSKLGSNIQIDPNAFKKALQNASTTSGTTVKIAQVSGLDKAIKAAITAAGGVDLQINDAKFTDHIEKAAKKAKIELQDFKADGKTLRDSITKALQGHEFPIQIKVMKNQAQMAVQNALNGAANITPANALTYQRLMAGDAKAAQAELTRLKGAHIQAADSAKTHARATLSLTQAMRGNISIAGELGTAMASLYSIHAAKEFLSNIIEIGGELEHQKIALDTIYGDPSKTETLFSQIKGLARESPFGVMDITKNVKQLSAYGVAYNEVYDTAKRLADISAATSVDINRLILAFGKTKNRTFLDGLEAKQFAYANIPIYDALSKKLTELEGKFVSVKEVMSRISKREIGFDMVKEILWDMTDEGGKFYNMQEKLAGSVKTSWKLVRDNIELMFGEMAESGFGSALKGIAETLQGLTRNWRTVGTVLAVGAAAFGVSRIAALALSRAVDTQTASLYNNMIAGKRKEAEELSRQSITRSLSAQEKELIATQNRLTASDIQLAITNGNLTQAQLKQLYVSGQITKSTLRQAVANGVLTQSQYKAIVGTNLLFTSTTKLWGGIKSLGNILANVGKSLGAFFSNPGTILMGALTAIAVLWQRNSEEMRKAEEIGDHIFNKAIEGAQNLENTLKDLKPADSMSELEMTQSIERLEEVIKDYSPQPILDINEALVAQDGHVNTLTERYEALVEKVKGLKEAFDNISNFRVDDMVENALKATNEGWFNDDLATNAKDYTKALKSRHEATVNYAKDHKESMIEIVKSIEQTDKAFREATSGMDTWEQKFAYVMENVEKYMYAFGQNDRQALQNIVDEINMTYDEMVSDTEKFIARLDVEIKKANLDIDTEEGKRTLEIALRDMLDKLEDASEEAKAVIAGILEQKYDITVIEDKIGPVVQEKFRNIAAKSGSEFVKTLAEQYGADASTILASGEDIGNMTLDGLMEIIRFRGPEVLGEGGRQMFGKMMDEAGAEAMRKLGLSLTKWCNYLAKHPGTWQVNVVFNTMGSTSDLQKTLWDNKGNLMLPKQTKIFRDWSDGKDSVVDIQEAAQSELKKTYNALQTAKKNKNVTQEYIKELQDTWDLQADTYERAGFGSAMDAVSSKKSGGKSKSSRRRGKGNTGSQKDELAEMFKQRLKDLKDAWSEYQKWEKTVGDEAAAQKIADSGLFGNMKAEDIPRNAEKYREAIETLKKELELVAKGHPEREKQLQEMIKLLLDVDHTIVEEQVKKSLAIVEDTFDRAFENYDLYRKLLEATGNEKLAYTFSFGIDFEGETDYVALIKKRVNAMYDAMRDIMKKGAKELTFETTNIDNVHLLPEELQKAWQQATKDINKYYQEQRNLVADLMKEYQTTAEEIIAIKSKAQKEIERIQEQQAKGFVSTPVAQNLIQKIQVKADFEVFKRSGDYLKFFNATLALSKKEIADIGSKIKKNLDTQLQQGVITAEEYCKEIEKINDRLKESEERMNTFVASIKGGLQGGLENYYKQQQDLFNAASDDYDRFSQMYDIATKNGDSAGMELYSNQMEGAQAQMEAASAAMEGAQGMMQTVAVIDTIVHAINDTVQGVKDAVDQMAEMADSMGVDTSAGTSWGDAMAFFDAFSQASEGATKAWDSLKSGNVGGVISGVVQSITSWFTVFNKYHDARLQKDIENSELAFKKLGYVIDIIEGKMEYFLGNPRELKLVEAEKDIESLNDVRDRIESIKNFLASGNADPFDSLLATRQMQNLQKEEAKLNARVQAYEEGGALGYERQLMIEQLEELERQRTLEEEKKKQDPEKIAQLTAEIEEQKQAIKDYAQEVANEIYGIDLSGWAQQIGDALVDAFAAGEDAAEAFEDTVADIMKGLVKNMITQDIIAPAFKKIQDWLFGTDGMDGAYSKDFLLDENKAGELANMVLGFEDVIEDAKVLYDAINEATGGLLDNKESNDNTLSAGIASVTEDTASLLASYINAIRADVAYKRELMQSIASECLPRLNLIAESQLVQLNMIAENTRRNMEAAEAIEASNERMANILYKATKDRSAGFYVN